MAVDLSDPKVLVAYNEIVDGALTDWLLLGYGQTPNKLSLYDTGSRGVDELREHLKDEVLFGFVRVEGQFCLIAYMPENVSGVKRARALVHSRAVGNAFRAQKAVLNASKPSDVDVETIMEKLGLMRDTSTEGSPIIGSRSIGANPRGPPPTSSHVKGTTYTEGMPPTPPASVPRHSQASGESRSNRQSASTSHPAAQRSSVDSKTSSTHGYQQRTIPTVPESAGSASPSMAAVHPGYNDVKTEPTHGVASHSMIPPPQVAASVSPVTASSSLPDEQTESTHNQQPDIVSPVSGAEHDIHAPSTTGGIHSTSSHDHSGSTSAASPQQMREMAGGEVEDLPPPPPPKEASYISQGSPRIRAASHASPNAQQASPPGSGLRNGYDSPDGLPQQPYGLPSTPRTEAQMHAALSRAKWEAEARTTGERRPSQHQYHPRVAEEERVRRERAALDRSRMDEEDIRRAQIEEAQRQEAARRLKLEEARRAEEARRLQQKEEAWLQQQRQKEEAALEKRRREEEAARKRQAAEEAKRAQREQWKAQKSAMQEKFKQLQGAGKVMLTGWASHQVGLIWRRRYFELRPDSLLLFKDAEGAARPVLGISVSGIQGVTDARDELELPNSLKIDFRDKEPAFFYCDSAEDKEVFLAALRQAAKL